MILGGMIWLKMEDIQIPTAIDLSKLGLDQIEEDDTEFKIGAMVTLRQLETHQAFNEATCYVFRDAVRYCRCTIKKLSNSWRKYIFAF